MYFPNKKWYEHGEKKYARFPRKTYVWRELFTFSERKHETL